MATYNPTVAKKKGVVEGGSAGLAALLASTIISIVTAKNPDMIPAESAPEVTVAATGILAALFAGVSKWFRNRQKHNTGE